MKRREYLIFTLILLLCTSSALIVGIKISDSKKNNSYFDDKTRRHVDTISMMLEQTSGAGDYVMTTRDSWPTEGYFFNPKLSKCENGGELSWDDTNKRVLMSGNTSDKCYVYFDKPLEFYLNDVLFQAAPNMTWEEWLNSSYSDNWTWKDKILTYEEVKQKGTWYKNDYEDKNRLLTATSSSSSTSLTLYTAATSKHSNPRFYSEGIILMKNQSIKNSFSELYDYVKKNLLSNEVSENDLNDNKYYVNTLIESCLTPDTLIDVEEIDEKGKKRRRRKKLKDIKVGDKVICINPFTLELDTDTVIECDGEMNKKHTCYDNWYFDDETILTTIHRHRFYNVENSKFMYMEEWNIGEHGININNKKIKLIKHEHIEEEINHCTLFTEKYNNYFANGLLSGNRRSKNIQL